MRVLTYGLHEPLASDLFRLFLRMQRLMNRRMAEQGASLARTKLLLFLHKRGPARAADIADFFDNAPRTVTEAIDGLERDGLVARTPDAHDRRVKQVSITDEGRRVLGETEPLRQDLIDAVFGALDADERAQLSSTLAKLLTALDGLDGGDTHALAYCFSLLLPIRALLSSLSPPEERMEDAMDRYEPTLCQCGFGLLCCASGAALSICAVTLLLLAEPAQQHRPPPRPPYRACCRSRKKAVALSTGRSGSRLRPYGRNRPGRRVRRPSACRYRRGRARGP